ncbi:YncE family protein [Nocardia sp. SYP-A9097]|uniref:YncE family protein n=1 Tax=Nocardia sp. SYP-A9097 TaxID=2663237 RepID=UPI00281629CA|nr:YncE family protein [Nocardia sp. SYP-A9097]
MKSIRVLPTLAGIAVLVAACSGPQAPTQTGGELPLRKVGEVALTGGAVRFDYTSLDAARGLLFLAHMGAGQVIEVDIGSHTVVRTIPDTPDVHGVLVVPDKHRVYATVTGRNQLIALDEDTGAMLFTAPTGTYPDGLAYDPIRNGVWTTNEQAGTETVIDADTGNGRATVPLGGAVGNVVYDSAADRMVVAVHTGALAIIAPDTFTVTDRIATPGCDSPHGLALDVPDRVMFVGCENNATLLTVDLGTRAVLDSSSVGATPDVLVYDQGAQRIYVAAESGWVSIFDRRDGHTTAAGAKHLADGAHTLALDPASHHSYFPIPQGTSDGGPALWEFEPTGS